MTTAERLFHRTLANRSEWYSISDAVMFQTVGDHCVLNHVLGLNIKVAYLRLKHLALVHHQFEIVYHLPAESINILKHKQAYVNDCCSLIDYEQSLPVPIVIIGLHGLLATARYQYSVFCIALYCSDYNCYNDPTCRVHLNAAQDL